MNQPFKTAIYSPESELARSSGLLKGMAGPGGPILTRLGNLKKGYLIDDSAKGKDT